MTSEDNRHYSDWRIWHHDLEEMALELKDALTG